MSKVWIEILKRWGLHKQAGKLLSEPVYVYSAVPKWAIPSIKEKGLLGGKLIAKDEELLEKIHPIKADRNFWLRRMKDLDLAITYEGPNVFFTVPPKSLSDHPVYKEKMKILKIDLSKLISDFPDTKLHGLELVPYADEEYEDRKDEIEKEISILDAKDLSEQEQKEQWDKYTGGGFFAGNVPHAVVATPDGKIAPEYIEF